MINNINQQHYCKACNKSQRMYSAWKRQRPSYISLQSKTCPLHYEFSCKTNNAIIQWKNIGRGFKLVEACHCITRALYFPHPIIKDQTEPEFIFLFTERQKRKHQTNILGQEFTNWVSPQICGPFFPGIFFTMMEHVELPLQWWRVSYGGGSPSNNLVPSQNWI